MQNTDRQLATVRRINAIDPIPGADAIEVATVDGWKVVVKKGEFHIGEPVIYFEIDSWIPTELAPFLSRGNEPREFNGVKGERLRTIKLRGQISQGLILPIYIIVGKIDHIPVEMEDVSELLNIQKWEKPMSAQLAGMARGNFPSAIPKTDQPRIQNMSRQVADGFLNAHAWQVTEKLDGSSCTFYLDTDDVFHVCSRNLDLKETEGNAFWQAARKYDVENKMRNASMQGQAIQGELIGPGIQGNQYECTELEFFVFDIYDVVRGGYVLPDDVVYRAAQLQIPHVPVLSRLAAIPETVEQLLEYAEGKSQLNNSTREGLVFKSLTSPDVSFKVISNKWLLKYE